MCRDGIITYTALDASQEPLAGVQQPSSHQICHTPLKPALVSTDQELQAMADLADKHRMQTTVRVNCASIPAGSQPAPQVFDVVLQQDGNPLQKANQGNHGIASLQVADACPAPCHPSAADCAHDTGHTLPETIGGDHGVHNNQMANTSSASCHQNPAACIDAASVPGCAQKAPKTAQAIAALAEQKPATSCIPVAEAGSAALTHQHAAVWNTNAGTDAPAGSTTPVAAAIDGVMLQPQSALHFNAASDALCQGSPDQPCTRVENHGHSSSAAAHQGAGITGIRPAANAEAAAVKADMPELQVPGQSGQKGAEPTGISSGSADALHQEALAAMVSPPAEQPASVFLQVPGHISAALRSAQLSTPDEQAEPTDNRMVRMVAAAVKLSADANGTAAIPGPLPVRAAAEVTELAPNAQGLLQAKHDAMCMEAGGRRPKDDAAPSARLQEPPEAEACGMATVSAEVLAQDTCSAEQAIPAQQHLQTHHELAGCHLTDAACPSGKHVPHVDTHTIPLGSSVAVASPSPENHGEPAPGTRGLRGSPAQRGAPSSSSGPSGFHALAALPVVPTARPGSPVSDPGGLVNFSHADCQSPISAAQTELQGSAEASPAHEHLRDTEARVKREAKPSAASPPAVEDVVHGTTDHATKELKAASTLEWSVAASYVSATQASQQMPLGSSEAAATAIAAAPSPASSGPPSPSASYRQQLSRQSQDVPEAAATAAPVPCRAPSAAPSHAASAAASRSSQQLPQQDTGLPSNVSTTQERPQGSLKAKAAAAAAAPSRDSRQPNQPASQPDSDAPTLEPQLGRDAPGKSPRSGSGHIVPHCHSSDHRKRADLQQLKADKAYFNQTEPQLQPLAELNSSNNALDVQQPMQLLAEMNRRKNASDVQRQMRPFAEMNRRNDASAVQGASEILPGWVAQPASRPAEQDAAVFATIQQPASLRTFPMSDMHTSIACTAGAMPEHGSLLPSIARNAAGFELDAEDGSHLADRKHEGPVGLKLVSTDGAMPEHGSLLPSIAGNAAVLKADAEGGGHLADRKHESPSHHHHVN